MRAIQLSSPENHPESGGVLLKVVFAAALLTGVSYTVLSTTERQTVIAKNLLTEHAESVLVRTISDAASSPYALVESAKANQTLANCTAKAGVCQSNATLTPLRLYDAVGTLIASDGDGVGYDSLGRRCDGRSCRILFRARASYSVACANGASSCAVANEIQVNAIVTKRGRTGQEEIFNATKNVGAIECGEGQALSGFENGGEPICTALSTGYAERHTDPTKVPICSESQGEIPVDNGRRPATPRAPVGSNEWTAWHAADWFAGTGPQGKGPWICQEEAYQLGLHCSNKYDALLSNPAHLICADFLDSNNGGSPLIEFDTSCNMTYIGCRGTLGCFAPDTQILMADQSTTQRVDSIKVGDMVWNPVTEKAHRVSRVVDGVERIPLLEFQLQGRADTVTVTQLHPMQTPTGMRLARDLQPPQRMLASDGKAYDIVKVRELHDFKGFVWNIEIEGGPLHSDHVIVANGVQTGDLYIQEQMAKHKDKKFTLGRDPLPASGR